MHHIATRPQLQRELKVNEKGLDSAMRKLVRLKIVTDTGHKRRENGPRFARIFELGPIEFEQAVYSVGPIRRGRRPKDGNPASALQPSPGDELAKVMRSFRQPAAESIQGD